MWSDTEAQVIIKNHRINFTTTFLFSPIDYNLYLAGYTDSNRHTIRHINLIVRQRNDLMEYMMHILESSLPDLPVLIIHLDKQLAEAFAFQLCNKGFWSMDITSQSTLGTALAIDHSHNVSEQLKDCLTTFRCLVTTMKFLRDNPNVFKLRPSVVINFDLILPCFNYLERWLNYRAESPSTPQAANAQESEKEEIFVYTIRFPPYDEENF